MPRRTQPRYGKARGGISQAAWDNMRYETRQMYRVIHPPVVPDHFSLPAYSDLPNYLPRTSAHDLVDFERYNSMPKLNGLAFRVIARHCNHYSLAARDPLAGPTYKSMKSHLVRAHGTLTLWVSVSSDWGATLRRVKEFAERGADDIVILVVDLEKTQRVIDVSLLRADLGLYRLLVYRRESLLYSAIPSDAVVAVIPAQSHGVVDIKVHLGSMTVPRALLASAGDVQATEDHEMAFMVMEWIEGEVYSCTGLWDESLALRILQSM
ncbi:hypothetical protein LTS12_029355, partial [Elasticomyces elasticus]